LTRLRGSIREPSPTSGQVGVRLRSARARRAARRDALTRCCQTNWTVAQSFALIG
jgi:hypothetical protein